MANDTTNSGYNKVVDKYFSHIEPIRRGKPLPYNETIVDNVINADAIKRNYKSHRNRDNMDYCRIGDCVLNIPPEKITVLKQSESSEYIGLRQKSSSKTKTGYRLREITIELVFNGEEQINGIKIPYLDGFCYVDGLRPLIAQIKRTPFLPIENSLLNNTHDIHGIVVLGINIATQEGFPNTISGQLVGYELNSQPYTSLPNVTYTDTIDWDMFRWYYQQGMDPTNTRTYLPPMDFSKGNRRDDFQFYIIDEDELIGYAPEVEIVKDENVEKEPKMVYVDIPSDVYITGIQVGVGNIIKNIQLSYNSCPVTQYFGSTSSMITCTLETSNEQVLTMFNNLNDTCERYARQYRNRTVQGYVRFKNQFSDMFGIRYVMIESVKIETVPGYPGLHIINILMTSFDRTQAANNRPKQISEVKGKGSFSDLLTRDEASLYRLPYYDKVVEDQLKKLELYPDLELPTYGEFVDAVNSINKSRIYYSLSELPIGKYYNRSTTDDSNIFKWVNTEEVNTSVGMFKDVPKNHFAYNHILALANEKILVGFPNNMFEPDSNITRAQTAAILCKVKKTSIDTSIYTSDSFKPKFIDTVKNAWYIPFIEKISDDGVMIGRPDGKFYPDEPITREDFIVATSKARNVSIQSNVETILSGISDGQDVSEYAKKFVAFAIRQGWVVGFPDGTIRPKEYITRAQACVIIAKIYNKNTTPTSTIVSGILKLAKEEYKDYFVDPDFYYSYPTLDEAGITEITSGMANLSDARERVSKNVEDAEKPWKLNSINNNAQKRSTSDYGVTTNSRTSGGSANYDNAKAYCKIGNINADLLNKYWDNKKAYGKVLKGSTSLYDSLKNGGIGEHIIQAAIDTGLNPALILAINIHESTWGTSQMAKDKYNFYGMGAWIGAAAYDYKQYLPDETKEVTYEEDGKKKKAKIQPHFNLWGKTFDLTLASSAIIAGAMDVDKHVIRANLFPDTNYNPSIKELKGYAADPNWYNCVSVYVKEILDFCNAQQAKSDHPDFSSPKKGVAIRMSSEDYILSGKDTVLSDYFRTRPENPATDVKNSKHTGIDIRMKEGEDVLSACAGEIDEIHHWIQQGFKAGTKEHIDGNGNYVTIKHDDGWTTKYLHLQDIDKSLEVGSTVSKGYPIGRAGSTGDTTEVCLHFMILKDGVPIDPLTPGLITEDKTLSGTTITEAPSPSKSARGGISATGLNIDMPGIDWNKFGKPLVAKIGNPDAFSNNDEGLAERCGVDMIQYNRRGTMCRAFPSFLMLFVDEGSYMNGRRLWSNYYVYHSIIDITVERDKRKPADTAVVKLINIYNSLNTRTKTYYDVDHTLWDRITDYLNIYTDSKLKDIMDLKNENLTAFNIKPGCRIHLRMGYGGDVDRMPIVFNGTISEIDTQDVVTFIAQSDGTELTNSVIGIDDETETNTTWGLGNEPQNIICNIMMKRDSNFWTNITGGKLGSSSAYGIEHFGAFYLRNEFERAVDTWNISSFGIIDKEYTDDQKKKSIGLMSGRGAEKPTISEFFSINSMSINSMGVNTWEKVFINMIFPSDLANKVMYENYDICKNIYLASVESGKTDISTTSYIGKTSWLFSPFDKEDNIRLFLYNRCPWDIFQTLTSATPEFICQPHTHQFRSTLFFGMPHWNVRYKYEYNGEDDINEYAKPYSQFHILTSLHDIVDNSISAVAPLVTNCIGTYIDTGGEKSTSPTAYADRSIRTEMQHTSIVDSSIKWSLGSIAIPDWGIVKFLNKMITGSDPGKNLSRSVAVSAIKSSFEDMYQGSLVILGDASIKPYDMIYIDDMYTGISGVCNVGRVVTHMGIDTGFITDIKPDLCVARSDVDASCVKMLRFLAIYASPIVIVSRSLTVANMLLCGTYARLMSNRFLGSLAVTAANMWKLGAVIIRGTTGIAKIRNAITIGGIALSPETAGLSLVVVAISMVMFSLLDKMFTTVIDFFENYNVIKIYPLWYKNKPYVAGINGHQNIIPGWTEEDFALNQEVDANMLNMVPALTDNKDMAANVATSIGDTNLEEGKNIKHDISTNTTRTVIADRNIKTRLNKALTGSIYRSIPEKSTLPALTPEELKIRQRDPENPIYAFPNSKTVVDKSTNNVTTYRPIKADVSRASLLNDDSNLGAKLYDVSLSGTNSTFDKIGDAVNKGEMPSGKDIKEAVSTIGKSLFLGIGRDTINKVGTTIVVDALQKASDNKDKTNAKKSYVLRFDQLNFDGIITPLPVFAYYSGTVILALESIPFGNNDPLSTMYYFLKNGYDTVADTFKEITGVIKYTSILLIAHPDINMISAYYNITLFNENIQQGSIINAGDLIGQVMLKSNVILYFDKATVSNINAADTYIQASVGDSILDSHTPITLDKHFYFSLFVNDKTLKEIDPLDYIDNDENAKFKLEDYKETSSEDYGISKTAGIHSYIKAESPVKESTTVIGQYENLFK